MLDSPVLAVHITRNCLDLLSFPFFIHFSSFVLSVFSSMRSVLVFSLNALGRLLSVLAFTLFVSASCLRSYAPHYPLVGAKGQYLPSGFRPSLVVLINYLVIFADSAVPSSTSPSALLVTLV